MIKVGLAGGIGSGKTTVAKVFKCLGIPTYNADFHAKRLLNESQQIKLKLIENFGTEIYQDNSLQKEILAKIIFNDKSALDTVNSIVHPAVRQDFDNWAKNCQTEIVLIEAAIMFDTGFYKHLDATILVLADEDQRIKRILKRDNFTIEHIKKRIQSQINPEKHKTVATYVINNNDKDEVLPQINNILKQLKNNG